MRIGRAAALSDTGRRRIANEDAYVLEPPLFAIADGMGGAQAGEVAARLAAATLEREGLAARDEAALTGVLQLANERIFERSTVDPTAAGMGTTATVVTVDETAGSLALAHVGDSRAYRLRGGRLERLTDDHSLVAELVRGGTLTEEEALVHPARSVITRVLGTEPTVDVDTFSVDLAVDDLIILCSDGLSAMVRDETILELATAAAGPAELTETLVAAANAAGGDDNITVVVFELLEGDPPERPVPAIPPAEEPIAAVVAGGPDEPTVEDVVRHGAGRGSRWPALLLIAAIVLVGLLALWWGISR